MNSLPAEHDGRTMAVGDDYHRGAETQPADPTGRISTIVQVGAIVWRRKWVIMAVIIGTFVAGLVVTLLTTRLYTASATLEIQRETQNFTNVEGAENGGAQRAALDPEYYQTQYGLLKARSLADRVAVALRLNDSEEFFQRFKSSKATKWFADGKVIASASTREERIRATGDILLSNLQVNPERMSRLVDISFTSPDPAFSKLVIDSWAAHFIQAALERRFETTSYARKFLEDRLGQLRTRIDESERQLVAYAAKEGIVNLPSDVRAGPDGQQAEHSLAADDLATLNRELVRATADRILAESRLTATGGAVTEALNNQAISTMRASRSDLQVQYAKLMNQFEPSYPPAQALQSQIRQLDRSIATEEARVRDSLGEAYRASRTREQQLSARVDALKSGVLDLRRRSIQYNVLEREVDTSRQLYDALLQRYKEIGIAGGVGVNNIAVVDVAELPDHPSRPNLPLNLALAVFCGVLLSGGVAFLLEQLSDTIDDPAEVPEMLGAPLIGTAPKVQEKNIIETLQDPKEVLTEAYFSLRTSLSFTTDHGFPRSLAVTSSRPAEGKSTTAYAIASSLARPTRRVLLIDADMRSPSIHAMLGVSGTAGLSNFLSGSDDLHSLTHETSQAGLHVLPAGPQPPSAADLLSGDRLERLIALLRERYDHVIIDAPPVMGLADAPLICSRAEGTIFVVEAHATGKGVARVALSRLQSSRVRVLGVLLTKFDNKRAHYGYGYNYGYGYGYGGSEESRNA